MDRDASARAALYRERALVHYQSGSEEEAPVVIVPFLGLAGIPLGLLLLAAMLGALLLLEREAALSGPGMRGHASQSSPGPGSTARRP